MGNWVAHYTLDGKTVLKQSFFGTFTWDTAREYAKKIAAGKGGAFVEVRMC